MKSSLERIDGVRLTGPERGEILSELSDSRRRFRQVFPAELLEEVVDRSVVQTPRPSRRLWIESVVAATSVAAWPQCPVTRS